MQKMLRSWLMELLLARNQHPSDAEIARVNTAKMDRNLRCHYGVILEFSAAICILSSQSISPNDVRRGSAALSRATQGWARMGCHLTTYYHFGMHFADQMYTFGPCYATWAFAFEWHNGKLARVNHNQHKGGELEATLMRRWWSITFNYDLVSCYMSVATVLTISISRSSISKPFLTALRMMRILFGSSRCHSRHSKKTGMVQTWMPGKVCSIILLCHVTNNISCLNTSQTNWYLPSTRKNQLIGHQRWDILDCVWIPTTQVACTITSQALD